MRIIAGKFKGTILNDFTHEGTRPTGDKARGGIFNTLVYNIVDANVLDLFGGTGAMGIEAESRGANLVYIVDNNIKSVKTIKSNCEKCRTSKTKVLCLDYTLALKKFKEENIIFDVVFIDPPYKKNFGEIALDLIYQYGLINQDSIICYEHDEEHCTNLYKNYDIIKQRKYGIAFVDYLQIKECQND